ncbi:MAG TPA: polysaccharide biosynthesis tyrosine autokinase [Candidatus Sericytochromatia bacterium]
MESKEPSLEIDLKQYWLPLKRRWLPAMGVFGVVVGLTALIAIKQKTVYQAEAKLWFQTSRSPVLTGLAKDIDIGRLEALTLQNNPLDTQAEIVRSIPVLQEVVDSLKLDVSPQVLARRLQVKGIVGTDVLQIAYQSEDPKLAAAVVNKVAEVYIRSNIRANRAEAASAREFIQAQLPKTEALVTEADSNLRRFREENKVIILDEEAKAAVRTIANIDDQIATARGQLADVAARSQQLSNQIRMNSRQALDSAALSQSPGVREALTALQAAQTKLTVEKSRFIAGPAIDSLESQVDLLETLVRERIRQIIGRNEGVGMGDLQVGEVEAALITDFVQSEATRQGIEQRISELASTQRAYAQQMTRLPRLEQTQRELERRLKAAQLTYETLLPRLQEIQLAENQNIGNARVISPAQLPEQGSSKQKIILAAGILAGMLLAIAAAFFLDLLDQSINTLKQAKERFRYTVLGVIPLYYRRSLPLKGKALGNMLSTLPVRDYPRAFFAEAYQMLQANLKFLSSDKPLKTIVVTSSVTKEGKSEVAANLAVAISQVGRRVLLVDADMRCPTQHTAWGLTNSAGLTNLIVDRVAVDEAVQEVMPNLWVLTSGDIPPNPMALLDSQRMSVLVKEFTDRYDIILFDTPPLTGIADAAVLGKMVDGLLLVVRPGIVDARGAIAAKELLTKSNQNVLGMVVNGVDSKSESDTRFYYNANCQSKHLQPSIALSSQKESKAAQR